MTTAFHVNVRVKSTTCCYENCRVVFAMDAEVYDQFLENHKLFSCPFGHQQRFTGTSETQRLREEKARLEERVAQEQSFRRSAERRTEAERRSTAAVKGHLTRAKKRAAHGVCPCCTRTFSNVQAHVDRMHPEFKAEHADA